MIILSDVTLTHPHAKAPILSKVSVAFGPRERIGILAAPGSGKSSIARLFSGVDIPTLGSAKTDGTSWPLGFAGFLHPHLSVLDNLGYVARLTGQNRGDFIARVAVLAGLEPQLRQATKNLTPTQRATLAYMCAMVTPSQTLIADDTLTVGDTKMRARCDALLAQRLSTTGLIFLSRNARQVSQFCHRYFALHKGRLIPCKTAALAQSLIIQENEYA